MVPGQRVLLRLRVPPVPLGAVVLSAFPLSALPLFWPVPPLPFAVISATVLVIPLCVQEHDSDVTSGQAHHWKLKPLEKRLWGQGSLTGHSHSQTCTCRGGCLCAVRFGPFHLYIIIHETNRRHSESVRSLAKDV